MSDKLTLLLPLYGRDDYTARQLSKFNSDNVPFSIYVADGCRESKKELVNEFSGKLNIKYRYFGYDENINFFMRKLYLSLEDIDTEYVVMIDNDDLIDIGGMLYGIDFLSNNLDYSAYRGQIKAGHKDKGLYYKSSNTEETAIERIKFAAGYDRTACWHNTFITKNLKEAFYLLEKSKTKDLQLVWTTIRYWHLLFGKSHRENDRAYYYHINSPSLVQGRGLYSKSTDWIDDIKFINSSGIYLSMFGNKLSELENITIQEGKDIIYNTLIQNIFDVTGKTINKDIIFKESLKYD